VDWHPQLREFVNLNRPAVMICEVKTGGYNRKALFPDDRHEYAIQRAGLPVPADPEWSRSRSFDHGSCVSYNLLVAHEPAASPRWHTIRIEDCVSFLRDRCAKYPEQFRDRVYFNSALIQFLAFESDLARRKPESAPR